MQLSGGRGQRWHRRTLRRGWRHSRIASPSSSWKPSTPGGSIPETARGGRRSSRPTGCTRHGMRRQTATASPRVATSSRESCSGAPFDGIHLLNLPDVSVDGDSATSRVHFQFLGAYRARSVPPQDDRVLRRLLSADGRSLADRPARHDDLLARGRGDVGIPVGQRDSWPDVHGLIVRTGGADAARRRWRR